MIRPRLLIEAEREQSPPNGERRGAARRPSRARADIQLIAEDGAACWRAVVRDVSTLGIALIVPSELSPAAILELRLQTRRNIPIRPIKARVVHVEDQSGGHWLVGRAFVTELDDAELHLFQAEKVKPATPDARRWVRFPCNVETVCYACDTAPGERRPARIVNVSAGGVGLLLPCDFSVGTLLHLEVPSEAARLALIRVVRVMEHAEGRWFLGCEFADQLAAEEVKDLVR